MRIDVLHLSFASRKGAQGGRLRHSPGLCAHTLIAAEGALDSVFSGDIHSLIVAPIYDLIGLIEADIGAVVKTAARGRARNDPQQSLFQRRVVLRKFRGDLPGGGIDSDAVGGG